MTSLCIRSILSKNSVVPDVPIVPDVTVVPFRVPRFRRCLPLTYEYLRNICQKIHDFYKFFNDASRKFLVVMQSVF